MPQQLVFERRPTDDSVDHDSESEHTASGHHEEPDSQRAGLFVGGIRRVDPRKKVESDGRGEEEARYDDIEYLYLVLQRFPEKGEAADDETVSQKDGRDAEKCFGIHGSPG